MKYTAPKAELISFETISVIMTSGPHDDDRLPDIEIFSNDESAASLTWE